MREQDERIEELEAIQLQYLEEWEAGQAPTVDDYLTRYPRFAAELAEFIPFFLEVEAAAAAVPESELEAPAGEAALERALAGASAPAANLREVRKAFGWTPPQLARELRLASEVRFPSWAILQFERGLVQDWSQRLERALGHVLCRTREEVAALLRASAPVSTPLAHYSAQGVPQAGAQRIRTFAEVLDESGELTDEERRWWLDDEGE